MQEFVQQHEANIYGVLSGFDRIRFRGTQRRICYVKGFAKFLNFIGVLLKVFRAFVDGTSRKLKKTTEQLARKTPVGKVVYLAANQDKQEVLDELLRTYAIPESFTGLIAVLSCVQNCNSYELHRHPTSGSTLGLAQVPALLSVHSRSSVRPDAHSHHDLVPDAGSDLHERSRVVGPADECSGTCLPTVRQHVCLGCRFCSSATMVG